MPQLNIICPKCRRFIKPTASKLIGELKAQAIGECKKCKIRILSLSTLSLNKKKWISNNYETDEKTFNKYLKQFKPKKERITVKRLILKFLENKKIAITKNAISKEILNYYKFKESTINNEISHLKKQKIIHYGFLSPYRCGFGARKKYVMLK